MEQQEEQALEMMLAYPFILPVKVNSGLYRGYLPVDGQDYYIEFEEGGAGIKLTITKELQQFVPDILNLESTTNKLSFLNNLKTFILSKRAAISYTNLTECYWHILTEYMELREFYININSSFMAPDLSQIKISYLDEHNRLHEISISTNLHDIRYIFRVVEHTFPINQNDLFEACSSLKLIYEKFVGLVNKLQSFFNIMDSLDENCWILDPVKPTTKDCYRRIGIDTNISVIVTVNPWEDSPVPDIKLLGPERLIESRKRKVVENLINWDKNSDFAQELLKLLDMDAFISRPLDLNTEVLLCNAGECCICFSLRLNDKLPEIICQNPSCEQLFHTDCLYQWLTSVDGRESFNNLYGNCPNCEKIISCPLKQ